MRYAVLSDVHGNIEALSAVADSIAAGGLEVTVCLGDIVGYGAEPERAVGMIRESAVAVVRGNHDLAATTPGAEMHFNEWAEEAILWTRERLSQDSKDFLRELPLVAVHGGALLVHASPRNPASWSYVLSERDASLEFPGFDETLCLIGHSHEPEFYKWDGGSAKRTAGPVLHMECDERYIANVGSVGQPRDGDPRAAYAVVDTAALTVEIVRVEYDAERAARKIVDAGLPVFLAERLSHGA